MNKLFEFKWLLLLVFPFVLSCRQPLNSKINDKDSGNAIIPVKGDSANTIVNPPLSNLSYSDIQYLDLMIPQDAMVEIYHNGNKAEMVYVDELKKYIETKHAIITVFETKNFPYDVKPTGRLYIHDTGDHRYVLYVF